MPGGGPTTATIYVIPNDLGIVGGDGKTITMTLTSSTAYNVVSGWSGAMVMINDDDPPTSSPPWDWADPQITAFTPAGAATSTTLAAPENAPVGDFIPIEIWIPPGTASSSVFVLDTTSAISYSYIPGGTEYAGSPGTLDGPSYGSLGPGQGYYQMLYVYATNSAATADVSATITLEEALGGAYFAPVSAFVDFKSLRIMEEVNDDSELADVTNSSAGTVYAGQRLHLLVTNAQGQAVPGLSYMWFINNDEDAFIVKNFDANANSNPLQYLNPSDFDGQQFSFVVTSPDTQTVEVDIVTPFGVITPYTTFTPIEPNVTAVGKLYSGAPNPKTDSNGVTIGTKVGKEAVMFGMPLKMDSPPR